MILLIIGHFLKKMKVGGFLPKNAGNVAYILEKNAAKLW